MRAGELRARELTAGRLRVGGLRGTNLYHALKHEIILMVRARPPIARSLPPRYIIYIETFDMLLSTWV